MTLHPDTQHYLRGYLNARRLAALNTQAFYAHGLKRAMRKQFLAHRRLQRKGLFA